MNQRALPPVGPAVLLAVLVPALFASPARAQEKVDGQRVRVTVRSLEFTGTKEGTLVNSESGRLSLVEARTRAIAELPMESVTKLEVRREHRATKKGFYIGMGVGGLLALLGSSIEDSPCVMYPPNSGPVAAAYNRECARQETATRLGFAAVLLAPAAIGAGFGSLMTSGTWSEVPIDHFRVRVRPEPGGGRVGLSFSF